MEVRGLDDEAFEGFVYADLGFHYAIALASQNPLFVLLVSSLSDLMIEIRRAASPHLDAIKTALGVHEEIYAAIEAKDSDTARGYMVQHLDQIEELLRAREPGRQTANG
jgi:GntR family transcriptional repressor for pyruvate dehydrogenase complex